MNKFKKILSTVFLFMIFSISGNFIFAGQFEDYVSDPGRTEEELKNLLEIASIQDCVLTDFITKNQFINHFQRKMNGLSNIEELEKIILTNPVMNQICSDDFLHLDQLPELYRKRKNIYYISKYFDLFNDKLEEILDRDDLWVAETEIPADFFLKNAHEWLVENMDKLYANLPEDCRQYFISCFQEFIDNDFFRNKFPILFQQCKVESLEEVSQGLSVLDAQLSLDGAIKGFTSDCVRFRDLTNVLCPFVASTLSGVTQSIQSQRDDLQQLLDSANSGARSGLEKKFVHSVANKFGRDHQLDRSERFRERKFRQLLEMGGTFNKAIRTFPQDMQRELKRGKTLIILNEFKGQENIFLNLKVRPLNEELELKIQHLVAGRSFEYLKSKLEERRSLILRALDIKHRPLALIDDHIPFIPASAEEEVEILENLFGSRGEPVQVEDLHISAIAKKKNKLICLLPAKSFGSLEYSVELFDCSKFFASSERILIRTMSSVLLNQARDIKLANAELKKDSLDNDYAIMPTSIYGFQVPSICFNSSPINSRADLFHFYYIPYEEFHLKGMCERNETDRPFFALNCFGELKCEKLQRTLGFFEMLVRPDRVCFHHFFKPLIEILRSLEQHEFTFDCQSINVLIAAKEALSFHVKKLTPEDVDGTFYREQLKILNKIVKLAEILQRSAVVAVHAGQS